MPTVVGLDGRDDLFVVNCPVCFGQYTGIVGSGNVAVYSKGKRSPSRIVENGISNPQSMAVAADGTLYVTNIGLYGNAGGTGYVSVYAPGAEKPKLTITYGVNDPSTVGVDSSGTVYVGNRGSAVLTEYPPGQAMPKATIASSGGCFPGDVTFDRGGHVYVLFVCETKPGSIGVYEPGQTTPLYTITGEIYGHGSFAIAP